jgi:hypothetical protein
VRIGLVTLLVASGCDVVYGLDRPPEPEPGTDMVTARFVRQLLGEAGGSIVESPLEATASVVLANGARPEVTVEDGTYTFAWTRDMTYQLTFERVDRPPITYVMNTEQLVVTQRELTHDGVAPAKDTLLDVRMSGIGTPSFTAVSSTGVWTFATSGVDPTSVALDWTAPSIFLTGRPRLLEPSDTLYCSAFDLVLDGAGGLAYNALKRWSSQSIDMQDGTTTPVTCVLEEATLERCARMQIDREAELERVTSVIPASFGSSSYATFVLALPTPDFGPWAAPWVVFVSGNEPVIPFDGTLHYTIPFPQHTPAVMSAMSRVRNVYAQDSPKPVQLSAGTRQFYAPAENCETSATVTDIAIPSPPAIGGAFVVNDGELQLSRTRPIDVSWETRTPGPVDYYLVHLYELVNDPEMGGSRLVEKHTWVTPMQEMTIARDVFESDQEYLIAVTTVFGWSGIADGDFRPTRWPAPLSTGSNYSGVFTVRP